MSYNCFQAPLTNPQTLIEASAGTGKTFTLSILITRLIAEEELPMHQIAVVTFTDAATADLIKRIRQQLREAAVLLDSSPCEEDKTATVDSIESWIASLHKDTRVVYRDRILAALREYDQAAISTIHGFCQGLLQEAAFESRSPLQAELLKDDSNLLQSIGVQFWKNQVIPNDVLSRIAWENDWTVKSLIKDFNKYRTHPQVRLFPNGIWPIRSSDQAEDISTLDKFEVHNGLRTAFFEAQTKIGREIKDKEGIFNFDDLIRQAHSAVTSEDGEALRQRYQNKYSAVMIDEFQDTDLLQYEMFHTLFGKGKGNRLFFVGDPKQAIYGFRGADIFTYFAAKEDVRLENPTYIQNLPCNYRSDEDMVKAVNALFEYSKTPFYFNQDLIPFEPVEAKKPQRLRDNDPSMRPLHWYTFEEPPSDASEAYNACYNQTALEILRLKEEAKLMEQSELRTAKPVHDGDIAILVRTNQEAQDAKACLTSHGIDAVIAQSGNVLESLEADELVLVMRAIEQPSRMGFIRSALATRLLGWSADEIIGLVADDRNSEDMNIDSGERLYAQFSEYRDRLDRDSISAVLMNVLDDFGAWTRLIHENNGERSLTNLRHLIEILQIKAASHRLPMQSLIAWFEQERTNAVEESIERELRLESDRNAVQIRTIFKSKGLEYPIVFLPTIFKTPSNRGPHLFHTGTLDGNISKEGNDLRMIFSYPGYSKKSSMGIEETRYKDAVGSERIAQDLRLLYVALTRAKHRTYVFYVPAKTGGPNSLSFLLLTTSDQPEDNINLSRIKDLEKGQWTLPKEFLESNESLTSHSYIHNYHKNQTPTTATRAQAERESARVLTRPSPSKWRVSSFSSLAQSVGKHPVHEEDVEFPAESANFFLGRSHGFRGRANELGNLIHTLFEASALQPLENDDAIRSTLMRYQFRHDLIEAPQDSGYALPLSIVLQNLLNSVLTCILPNQSFCLCDIAPDSHWIEKEFHFPIQETSDFRKRLSNAIATGRCANDGHGEILSYAKRLRTFSQLDAGMMKGLIDLIFSHKGRWYILDWKSNYLGHRFSHYSPEAVAINMSDHQYILQYHLYVLALHRLLRATLESYDYEQSFGGVYYAYVRGIRPQSDTGWYFDKPPRETIDALDDLFQGEGGR